MSFDVGQDDSDAQNSSSQLTVKENSTPSSSNMPPTFTSLKTSQSSWPDLNPSFHNKENICPKARDAKFSHNKPTVEIWKLNVARKQDPTKRKAQIATGADTQETEHITPYHKWECGFGFKGQIDQSREIPNTKTEFLTAVKKDIATVASIQNGLIAYNDAIQSGTQHEFSTDFLKHQTDATNLTINQLSQIANDLHEVVRKAENSTEDCNAVRAELKQSYAHTLPWIRRTRAVLISAHVFYKINYVLGSDKTQHDIYER